MAVSQVTRGTNPRGLPEAFDGKAIMKESACRSRASQLSRCVPSVSSAVAFGYEVNISKKKNVKLHIGNKMNTVKVYICISLTIIDHAYDIWHMITDFCGRT